MVDANPSLNKKRTLTYMHANELASRLKSKKDFIIYLNQHCKYLTSY